MSSKGYNFYLNFIIRETKLRKNDNIDFLFLMRKLFILLFLIGLPPLWVVTTSHSTHPVLFQYSLLALIFMGLILLYLILMFLAVIFYPRHTSLVIGSFSAIIMGLITFVIADMLLFRIFVGHLSPSMQTDPIVHHRMEPNTTSLIHNKEFSYITKTNSLGLRSPEVPLQKPINTTRIILLGDSFTLGKGVPFEQSSSALLEKSLKQNYSVEIINAGVDSYSPILSYLQLKKTLLPLNPDIVILNLDMSDLEQETFYRGLAQFDTNIKPLAVINPDTNTDNAMDFNYWVGHTINKNFYFLGFTFRWIERLSHKQSNAEVTYRPNSKLIRHTFDKDVSNASEKWNNLFASILWTQKLCSEHNIFFALSIYPWGHQVNATEWIPGRYAYMPLDAQYTDASRERIQTFSKEHNIPLLDTFDAFRAYNGTEKLYYDYDPHWRETGYQLMAGELETFIKKHLQQNR